MSATQPDQNVREVLSTCVTEFFYSYGLDCYLVDEPPENTQFESPELGSVVGFRGKGVRGGLALVAPMDFIAELLPVPRSVADGERQLRDWSGEMANQLVGRLKNKLSARSVDFEVGMPICFTGKGIRFVFLPDAEGLSLCFRAAATSVRVHLDCSLSPELAAGDVTGLRIVPEGNVLLF